MRVIKKFIKLSNSQYLKIGFYYNKQRIITKIKDKMFAFIYDSQQRIYTVPRLE